MARGWPEYELKQAYATGRFEDEGWRVRKDGTLFWANVVITAARNTKGEIIGYAKMHARSHREARRGREAASVRRALSPARGKRERLCDLHARSRAAISRAGTRARCASRAISRRRFSASTSRRSIAPRISRRNVPEIELQTAIRSGPRGERRLARAQGRLALLGERGDHRGVRRASRAARLREGHARHERAQAPRTARSVVAAHQRVSRDARARVAQSARAGAQCRSA